MAHRHPTRCSYNTQYAVNLVASGHKCAANSGLPLQYQQQPGESYSGSCIAKGWQHYIILQTEAHLAISSCTYSTFLIGVADADADPNCFPRVELRQTPDVYAHDITGMP
jgi:hypothetical protein